MGKELANREIIDANNETERLSIYYNAENTKS